MTGDRELTTFEFTQRAENGGNPLDNETAHRLGIGHGTSLLVIPKCEFVALLKKAQLAAITNGRRDFAEEVEELIREHDQFVVEVR